MTFDSHPLKLHQPMHTLPVGPMLTAPAQREIDRQCLRVLRCTAQALAAGAGGLRFKPGSRPWLAGLDVTGAMRAGQGAGGGHASSPEPLR